MFFSSMEILHLYVCIVGGRLLEVITFVVLQLVETCCV